MLFKIHSSAIRFCIFCIFCFSIFTVNAQILKDNSTKENNAIVKDPYGRMSPRSSVKRFISALGDQNYELASQYLNLKGVNTGKNAVEISKILHKRLDKGDLMPLTRISNDSSGHTNDDLPSNIDRVGMVEIQGDSFDLLVELTVGAEGNRIWLFSSETVKRISTIAVDEELLIDKILPASLKANMWGGVAVGQWIVVIVLIALAFLISWLITRVLTFLIQKLWKRSSTDPTAGIIKALSLPVLLYLSVLIFLQLFQELGLSIILRERFSILTIIVGVTAILLLFWRLVDFIGDNSKKRLKEQANSSVMSVVIFLQRLFKIIIVIIGIIVILSILGVNVTAGLAALGIGGIALALGAQKTMENFVGSVTLIADQPIRVGDSCKVGNIEGTVESIGMRSTRIRTDNRTIVTIPNGQFSSDKIENFTHRDIFLFNPVLELRYETTPDQIRYLLVEIRSMLYSHPKLVIDPVRVRFTDLGPSSIILKIFTYVNAENNNEFLEIKEDLLLRVMDIVKQSGTDFAFPSQTLYIARDKGISEEKTKSAEEQVQKWRAADDLQIPKFDPHRIQRIKNTLSYPAEGSFDRESGKST